MSSRSPRRFDPHADRYSISTVSARTGLSQDVLRVWERRYGAVEPARSTGNQRLYSDADIARFRLLAAATSNGRRIRNVANLSMEALEALVAADDAPASSRPEPHDEPANARRLGVAVAFTMALDSAGLDAFLRRAIAEAGLPNFLEVDAPTLMRRVGEEWAAGRMTVGHEHLASGVVLNIIHDAIRALPTRPSASRLLVATISREQHGIGAALAAAVAALDGWAIVHLGVEVPSLDIADAAATIGARAVALSVVHENDRAHVLREVGVLRRAATPDMPILVGGAAALAMTANLAAVGGIVCRSFADFRTELRRAESSPHTSAS